MKQEGHVYHPKNQSVMGFMADKQNYIQKQGWQHPQKQSTESVGQTDINTDIVSVKSHFP